MGFTLGIEVTRRCNFRCAHCFVDAGPPRAHEAGRGELEALVREAARSRVVNLGWSGGEPLLRQDLEALTATATRAELRVGLVTNGYLAARARRESLRAAVALTWQRSDGSRSRR